MDIKPNENQVSIAVAMENASLTLVVEQVCLTYTSPSPRALSWE